MRRLIVLLSLLLALPAIALEKTWYTSPNNLLDSTSVTTSSQNQLWFYYAALTGVASAWTNNGGVVPATGLWTVWCSSDGSGTAGVPHLPTDDCSTSHNDAWTTTYTPANLVRATAGTNHSWMVLKSAGVAGYPNVWMLIDWSTASDQTVTIQFSTAAFLCAANPCLATTAPVSTNLWQYGSAGLNPNSIATQNYAHISMSAEGSFWIAVGRAGLGYISWPLVGVFLADNHPSDPAPFFTAITALTGSTNTGAKLDGRNITDTNLVSVYTPAYVTAIQGVSKIIGLTATWEIGMDPLGGWFALPAFAFDNTGLSLRGRLPDFRLAPTMLPSGAIAPVPGPFTRLILYSNQATLQPMWFPYNSATLPIL